MTDIIQSTQKSSETTYDMFTPVGPMAYVLNLSTGATGLEALVQKEYISHEEVFNTLYAINVNDYTEERKNLTYLPWTDAITEVKKVYPDATYNILWFDGKPYLYDEHLGYMVFTVVTIEGRTELMWLPVLDTNNKAMLDHEYSYDTRNQKGIKVAAATFYDINKALMRCLVKNFALFGLGMYIYKKDSLPEPEEEEDRRKAEEAKVLAEKRKEITELGKDAIGKKKITGPALRTLIEKLNPAGGAPGDIEDVAIADAVIAEIKKLKSPPKKAAKAEE